jgi:cytochrome c oxidase subunit 2
MHKWVMTALLIAAIILGIVVSMQSIADAKKEMAEQTVDENELRIVADEFFFDQEEYTVEAGKTMKITLKNKKGIHGVQIQGLDINVMAGEPVEYTFDTPGTYQMVCSIQCGIGHSEMVSTLVVTEAGPTEAPEQNAGH